MQCAWLCLSLYSRGLNVTKLSRPLGLTRCHCCHRELARYHSHAATVTSSLSPPTNPDVPHVSSTSSSSLRLRSRRSLLPSAPSFAVATAARRGASTASSPGILSSLSSRLSSVVDERRAVSADNKFSSMVSDMLAVGKYRLSDHVRFMEATAADAGVVGWKSYMPGVSGQAGVEELKRMLSILHAFTPAEQSDASSIGRDARLRVATGSSRTVADINFVLRQYSGAVMVHQWLHSRRARGLPLPASQAELSNMMAVDRPPQSQQMRHKPRRR